MKKTLQGESEIVSQVLFGEQVSCIEESGQQTLVQTSDGYQGWVYSIALYPEPYGKTMVTSRNCVPLYHRNSIELGPLFYLPFGVGVKVVETDSDWHKIELPGHELCFLRRGNLMMREEVGKKDLVNFCQAFIGIPYLWGGRSSFGYDCSGFSQMIYQQMGIQIPRDSSLQSRDSRFVEGKDPAIGDLIFWGETRELIGHVGIYLGNNQFIHASVKEHKPWVRISSLSDPAWNCQANAAYPYRMFKTLG